MSQAEMFPVTAAGESSGAVFSPCRTWRYALTRTWDTAPPLVVVGLNPSTADERADDPTIRRCIGFARRERAGGLLMLNLYGWRATDPDAMWAAWRAGTDIVGPGNDEQMLLWAGRSRAAGRPVLAAWGTHGHGPRVDVVRALLAKAGASVVSLGTNRDGSPKHPLYVRAVTPFEPWPAS